MFNLISPNAITKYSEFKQSKILFLNLSRILKNYQIAPSNFKIAVIYPPKHFLNLHIS